MSVPSVDSVRGMGPEEVDELMENSFDPEEEYTLDQGTTQVLLSRSNTAFLNSALFF